MKKELQLLKLFLKRLSESKRKLNKTWIDKGNEFHNRSTKSWLESNIVEIYLTNHIGKSVFIKRFIRTLKTKIYKYVASISKNVYIDKLDDIVNKYNNTYPAIIKMKAVGVKNSM